MNSDFTVLYSAMACFVYMLDCGASLQADL